MQTSQIGGWPTTSSVSVSWLTLTRFYNSWFNCIWRNAEWGGNIIVNGFGLKWSWPIRRQCSQKEIQDSQKPHDPAKSRFSNLLGELKWETEVLLPSVTLEGKQSRKHFRLELTKQNGLNFTASASCNTNCLSVAEKLDWQIHGY